MTTTENQAVPTMSFVEKVAFQASVALEKDSALVRGWQAGNDADILAAVAVYNERERARVKAAALAMLKL